MNFSEPILLWYERRRNIFNRAAQSSLEQSQSTKQLLCHTLVSQPSATVATSDSFSRVGEAAAHPEEGADSADAAGSVWLETLPCVVTLQQPSSSSGGEAGKKPAKKKIK